jgi:hypothetical protein
MGRSSKRHPARRERPPAAARAEPGPTARSADVRTEAEAALGRILRANQPGKVSLAGAYALGYGALGLAQRDGDGPDWYHDLDPLDTLFLGTAWPWTFSDAVEFGNARSAWLRLLRDTPHWRGIERFVREVLAASEEHALPVDDGELMLLLAARLEPAGLDRRKLPASLLPRAALNGARFVDGPPADLPLPAPPADAAERVARLWAATEVALRHDGTAAEALREGLHMLTRAGLPVRTEPALLLIALYAGLAAGDEEQLREAGERAAAWAFGLREESPLLPVVDVLLVAPHRGLGVDETLARLFGVAAFTEPVAPADCGWHGAPGAALVDSAFELGYRQVLTSDRKIVRLDPGEVALLEAQTRRFEEKFGRPPGPDDPLFFDPDADQNAHVPDRHGARHGGDAGGGRDLTGLGVRL